MLVRLIARLIITSTALGVVTAYLPAHAAAVPAATPSLGWRLFASPSPTGSNLALESVSAASATDAWAVGSIAPAAQPQDYQLSVWRWDGLDWDMVSLPKTIAGVLSGAPFTATIRTSSPSDVWIFDSLYLGAFWIHRDGNTWSYGKFPAPAKGQNPTINTAVDLSSRDVWALGSAGGKPYTEHFNGTRWRASVIGGNWGFQVASAASRRDIWATTGTGIAGQPRVVRWTGRSWSAVHVPSFSGQFTPIGVLARGPDDVWLGGSLNSGAGTVPAVAHWNGRSWRAQTLGHSSTAYRTVPRLVGDGAGGLWALVSNIPGPGQAPVWRFWHHAAGTWVRGSLPIKAAVALVTDVAHVLGTRSTWAVGLRYPTTTGDEEGMILLAGPTPAQGTPRR